MRTYRFTGFKGINQFDSPTQLGKGESPDCLNVMCDGKKIAPVHGYDDLVAAIGSQRYYGIWNYTQDGGTEYLLLHYNTEIYRYNGTDTLQISGATNCGTVASQGITFLNKSYFTNTTLGLYSWDGTTFAAATGPGENCKYIATRQNRLYLYGGVTNPSGLYVSAINTIDWTVPNGALIMQVGKGDGDIAMGLWQMPNYMLLFKRRSLWYLAGEGYLTGAGQFSADKVATLPGTVSQQTIRELDGWVYWMGDKGVYRFNGQTPQDITGGIRNLFEDGLLYTSNATGYIDEGKYVLSICTTGTTNNKRIMYDPRADSWTLLDSPNIIAASEYTISGKRRPVAVTGSATGKIYNMHTGTNADGTAIDAYWTTPRMQFSTYEFVERVEVECYPSPSPYMLNCSWRDTEDWSDAIPVSMRSPSTLSGIVLTVPIRKYCSAFEFKLEDANLDETFEIREIRVVTEPTERRV